IGEDAIRSGAAGSMLYAKYGATIDRESAYERLAARIAAQAPPPAQDIPLPDLPHPPPPEESAAERIMNNPAVKSFLRSAASAAGREISRSIFGTRRR